MFDMQQLGLPGRRSSRAVLRRSPAGLRLEPPRDGFTILELLICIAVVAVLIALLLPAVNASREAARRIQCLNNLRQIGTAIASYHDVNDALPIGWNWESSGHSAFGWAVGLLPYVEQRSLFREVDGIGVLDELSDPEVRHQSIAVYLCPSDISSPTFTLRSSAGSPYGSEQLFDLPTANYVGVFGTMEADDSFPAPNGDGSFIETHSLKWPDLTDGLSNTMIVGERTMARVPSTWLGIDIRGEDAACRLVGSAITTPNCSYCDECEFDSRHDGGANFLWADGHASLMAASIDTNLYREAATRSHQ